MPDEGQSRAQATAAVLNDLLAGQDRYRRMWMRRAGRSRGVISQAGVARVIEDHLVETGEIEDDSPMGSRQLKDRISRLLKGEVVSFETVRWMIAAFQMNADDEARLWDAAAGRIDTARGVSNTLRKRREMLRPQDHRTVAIVERYIVGSHGELISRRTQQTIEAIGDAVDVYIFNHEPYAAAVDVIHGGKTGRRHEYGEGLVAVEIFLDEPLDRLQTTALEYHTEFESDSVVSEVRRAAFARAEHVDFAVEFAHGKLPVEVWWCAWDDHLGGRIVREEPVPLQRRAARRYVPFIEETVVGFRWQW